MSHVILWGHWCHDVLNFNAPTEDKTDDLKDSFYKELECVFDKFLKYQMKILLGDFSAKVGKEGIFKPTIGNESLHKISNDNGVRLVNFTPSKNLRVKNMMFPHCNIHIYIYIHLDVSRWENPQSDWPYRILWTIRRTFFFKKICLQNSCVSYTRN
jgi:hypothetical protein